MHEVYGPYVQFLQEEHMTIHTDDITKQTWNDYFQGLLNILKDGIETELVEKGKFDIVFGNGKHIRLTLPDLFMNIIFWRMIVYTDTSIEPKHLFFAKTITKNDIADYMNKMLIIPNRKNTDVLSLNNIIDDTLYNFKYLNQFSLFLANTYCLHDDVLMMKKSKRYREILHTDLSNIPLEQVKSEGMKLTNEMIKIITEQGKSLLGFEHGLANAFRAKESVKPKQYKEIYVNIGTKPDIDGTVFPHSINHSFLHGGVRENVDYMIDASTGRTAQILAKVSVGKSGGYARILGLNNIDTILHPDPRYVCDTKNLVALHISSEKMFNSVIDRYFRWEDGGTSADDILIYPEMMEQLLYKTIYLRSPETCASAARGEGVCFRCYGDVAFTNRNINIGKYAAEKNSEMFTQQLLSAKHLIDTKINIIEWNENFNRFFEFVDNGIRVKDNLLNVQDMILYIDPLDMSYDNDEDYDEESIETYNEYVDKIVVYDGQEEYTINTTNNDNMYISQKLKKIIKTVAVPDEERIAIPFSVLADTDLFYIFIRNNGLGETLRQIKNIINLNSLTTKLNKDSILQKYMESMINGGIDIRAVHAEILIMNQLRDYDDITKKVDWTVPHAKYNLVTLNTALTKHPSPLVTLEYNKLKMNLCTPLTYKKNGASFVDMFFMKNPQKFIKSRPTLVSNKQMSSDREENKRRMFIVTSKPKTNENNI